MPAMPNQDPETTLRRYFQRVLNERDLSALDDLLAPDYIDHDAPPGSPAGPAPVRAYLSGFLSGYLDLRVTVEDVLVSGNKAAARVVWLGRPIRGGEVLHEEGIIIVRFNARGQMAERWSAYKQL